jgi:hypothetical protein
MYRLLLSSSIGTGKIFTEKKQHEYQKPNIVDNLSVIKGMVSAIIDQ